MSSAVSPTTRLLVDLLSALPLLVLLAFFGLHPTIRGHSLRVGRFGLLSLHDIRYTQYTSKSKDSTARGSVAHLHFQFHLPRPSDPRWCTITFSSLTFSDASCSASLEDCTITLSLIPRASGKSAGPWVHLTLSGLDITVSRSSATPGWVQRVRSDVVRTLLTGTIMRCDYARTAMHFAPPASAPLSTSPEENDEMVLSLSGRGLLVQNARDRVYDVQSVEWGCRRSWLEGGGAMWLVAEEVRWSKQHAAWRSQKPGWRHVVTAFAHIPQSIYNLVADPTAHADVRVPSCRVQFEAFRVRDAELLRQGAMLAHERFVGLKGGFGDALWGVLASVVAP